MCEDRTFVVRNPSPPSTSHHARKTTFVLHAITHRPTPSRHAAVSLSLFFSISLTRARGKGKDVGALDGMVWGRRQVMVDPSIPRHPCFFLSVSHINGGGGKGIFFLRNGGEKGRARRASSPPKILGGAGVGAHAFLYKRTKKEKEGKKTHDNLVFGVFWLTPARPGGAHRRRRAGRHAGRRPASGSPRTQQHQQQRQAGPPAARPPPPRPPGA